MFRALVLARVIEPTSKLDSLRVLEGSRPTGPDARCAASTSRSPRPNAPWRPGRHRSSATGSSPWLAARSRWTRELDTKARMLAGWKSYITNITQPSPEFVIGAYRQLWRIEKSFRVSKHDLRARPIYHHKRESIEAYLAIVFAALAVTHEIEDEDRLVNQEVRPDRSPLPHRRHPRRRPRPHRRGAAPDRPTRRPGPDHLTPTCALVWPKSGRQLGAQLGHPLLDGQVVDLGQWRAFPARHDVIAHDRGVPRGCRDLVVPGGEPATRIVAEADPAGVRADVAATVQRGLDLGEVRGSLAPSCEASWLAACRPFPRRAEPPLRHSGHERRPERREALARFLYQAHRGHRPTDEIAYVGDHIENDIRPAAAGLFTAGIKRGPP
jgi:hypothetical protein